LNSLAAKSINKFIQIGNNDVIKFYFSAQAIKFFFIFLIYFSKGLPPNFREIFQVESKQRFKNFDFGEVLETEEKTVIINGKLRQKKNFWYFSELENFSPKKFFEKLFHFFFMNSLQRKILFFFQLSKNFFGVKISIFKSI